MEGLIELIDEITKFGLYPLVELSDKERNLEWNLIKLYKFYFDIKIQKRKNKLPFSVGCFKKYFKKQLGAPTLQ